MATALLSFLLSLQPLADLPCRDLIEQQLAAWHAGSEVLKAPGGPLGGEVYRIATGTRGVWITLHRPRGLEITSLFLTDAEGTVRLDFGADCSPVPIRTPSAPPREDGFTDAELNALLTRNDRLIVYLWSPHLPLSVEGYAEIEHAARAVGVDLVAVVDASADRELTAEIADESGIPIEATRPLSSIELLFRDFAVHTPTVLVFSDGLASAPLPGYRNREAYRLYLEKIFRR